MLAVRDECTCGHSFLICTGTSEHDDEARWSDLVRAVAARIGASYVEANGYAHVKCDHCGAVSVMFAMPARGEQTHVAAIPAAPRNGSLN